jgi:hypothetical protein
MSGRGRAAGRPGELLVLTAGLATDLCDCEFTSIQQRLQEAPAHVLGLTGIMTAA